MTHPTPLPEDLLLEYHAGLLPPETMAQVAARLAGDPAAQALLADWRAQDAALAALYQPVAAEPPPARLTAALRQAQAAERRKAPRMLPVRLMAAVALVALGLAGGWFGRDLLAPAPLAQAMAAAAMDAHETFVVEVVHPVEVAATEEAHLNAWMSKRLGHEIRPPDFAAAGFGLLGGRILPADPGTAALYMYENAAGQRITLYIAPEAAATETAFRFAQRGETQSFFWTDRDLSYAVVGAVPRDMLRRIAVAAYEQLI